MIFSKDKKPAEPGWYWVLDGRTLTAIDLWISESEYPGRLCFDFGDMIYPVDDSPIKWGDRIETPTVEQA